MFTIMVGAWAMPEAIWNINIPNDQIMVGMNSASVTFTPLTVVILSGSGLPRWSTSLLEAVAHGSAVAWRHFNLLGEYDFSEEQLRESIGIRLPKMMT